MLDNVADNLRPMCPDFPIPETITLPLQLSIASTESEKSNGKFSDMISMAFASAFRTRLATTLYDSSNDLDLYSK